MRTRTVAVLIEGDRPETPWTKEPVGPMDGQSLPSSVLSAPSFRHLRTSQ